MDRVLVLETGNIIEDGTPEQLLAKKGLYYMLWQQKTGSFLSDKEITVEDDA